MKLLLQLSLFAALAVCAVPSAFAQSPAGTTKEREKQTPQIVDLESESFRVLRDDRARLLGEIDEIDKQLPKLNSELQAVERVTLSVQGGQRDLERAQGELKVAAERKAPLQAIEELKRRIDFIQSRYEYDKKVLDASRKPTEIRSLIDKQTLLLNENRKYLAEIESAIERKLSVELVRQDFKKTMSMTFAGLVAFVIIGFFVISWRDGEVRRAVFSGQAGIQLLTLFSLVIAIILFGITGVLEGKELSALLGGLSGYILGRVTQPPAGGSNVPSTPAAAPVPAPGSVG